MEQQDGYLAGNASGVGTPVPPAAYELRPLTLGEILDRTFSIYRSNFKLFVGLAALPAAVELIMNLIQLAMVHPLRHQTPQLTTSLVTLGFACVSGLLLFLAANMIQAATVFALSETYLGNQITIVSSLRATISRWYSYLGVALWQIGSFIWIPILLVIPGVVLIVAMKGSGLAILGGVLVFIGVLGGYIGGLIMYLRNSLGVQAVVIEGLTVRKAMRRSKVLTAGAKGRIFVVLLISGVLYIVIAMLQAPLLFLIGMAAKHGNEAIGAHAGLLLVNFAGRSLVGPVAMIGVSLVYFDQRVRMEALDLVMLMGGDAPARDASEDFWNSIASSSSSATQAAPAAPLAVESGAPGQSAEPGEGDAG